MAVDYKAVIDNQIIELEKIQKILRDRKGTKIDTYTKNVKLIAELVEIGRKLTVKESKEEAKEK